MNCLARCCATLSLTTALLALAACSPDPGPGAQGSQGRVEVVTSIYPFEFLAEAVLGDLGTVTTLTPAGTEPHDFEPTIQQVALLSSVDLVVSQQGVNASVDRAIDQAAPAHLVQTGQLVDLMPADTSLEPDEHQEDASAAPDYGYDPHTWLDPANMVTFTAAITDQLVAIDPGHAETYRANAARLTGSLQTLDDDFRSGLTGCERTAFITSHAAFGYLARSYGLQQLSIAGISPEDEPSPARLLELQTLARQYGLTTIFYETTVSAAYAQTLAQDLGLRTDVLDPVESVTEQSPGGDYLEIMTHNLGALRTANGCR